MFPSGGNMSAKKKMCMAVNMKFIHNSYKVETPKRPLTDNGSANYGMLV